MAAKVSEDREKVWITEAVPTIINGGPVHISRTINVKLNKMIDDLEGWPAHEMWMGVVPKKLTALLEDIGVSKKEVHPGKMGTEQL